jgi:hypothetical protein
MPDSENKPDTITVKVEIGEDGLYPYQRKTIDALQSDKRIVMIGSQMNRSALARSITLLAEKFMVRAEDLMGNVLHESAGYHSGGVVRGSGLRDFEIPAMLSNGVHFVTPKRKKIPFAVMPEAKVDFKKFNDDLMAKLTKQMGISYDVLVGEFPEEVESPSRFGGIEMFTDYNMADVVGDTNFWMDRVKNDEFGINHQLQTYALGKISPRLEPHELRSIYQCEPEPKTVADGIQDQINRRGRGNAAQKTTRIVAKTGTRGMRK